MRPSKGIIVGSCITAGVALVTAAVIAIPGNGGQGCHYNGVLPDAHCTPGTTNPQVTQGTIMSTICVKGWTATVRPPVSVTQPIKAQVERDYGVPDPHPKPFSQEELDHLIPLELGGAPADVKNLWPEAAPGYHSKDQVENQLKAAVCAGTITLTEAQRQIASDWTRGTVAPFNGNPDQ